jgi:hypothetical protein
VKSEPYGIGTLCGEVAANKVRSGHRDEAGKGGARDFPVTNSLDAVGAHQPFDGTTGHTRVLLSELIPDFELAIDTA